MKRRELIKMGFLAPLVAALDRLFGWLRPRRLVRGWKIYLDGSELKGTDEYVTVGDSAPSGFDPDEPFSMGMWFKSSRPATVVKRAHKKIPEVKFRLARIVRAAESDDGQWHHVAFSYNGSKEHPRVVVHEPLGEGKEYWL
jgi:hypothetical protein